MTIGAPPSRVSFNCDGTTKVFPIPLQAYQAADLTVTLTASAAAGGGEATLVLNSDYSLSTSSTDQPPKWTLTTLAASAYLTGYTLQVFVNPVQQQQTQYVQGQAFPSLALQANIDRLTQMVQRLQDQVSRAIRAPDGDTSPLMLLPVAANRLSQSLMMDANGNVTLGVPNTQVITTALLAPFLNLTQTPAEIAASVTPVNYAFPEWDLRRRGIIDFSGATDYSAQIAQAILVASTAGSAGYVWHPGGTIGHASKITIPNGVTVCGFDRKHCEFSYSGTGIGWQNVNGPNSSGYGLVSLYGLKITSTNAANTEAAIDIRAGGFNYYELHDLWIFGKWQYGLVLDGAELAHVHHNLIDLNGGQAASKGVWLVNGADRAVGQGQGFTNVIEVSYNQISGSGGVGICDDGGNCHTFIGNNTNQFPTPAYFAGVTGLTLQGNSFELTGVGTANANVFFQSKTFAGVPCGPCTGFSIQACGFYGNVSAGSLLSFAGTQFSVSAITRANPCVVTFSTVSSLNPFQTQQFIYFSGITGMVELNGKAGIITALGGVSGAWTATLVLDTSSGYTAYVSGGVGQMMHSGGLVKANNFGAQTGRTGAIDVTYLANSECSANYDGSVSGSNVHYIGAHADTNGNLLRPPQNGAIPALGTGVVGNQLTDTRYRGIFGAGTQRGYTTVTYSASMTFDLGTGDFFEITATNASAFTINSPSNANPGNEYTITLKNTSGGALGVVTMGPSFKLAGGGSTLTPTPATGNNRSVKFLVDGAGVSHEQFRTASDVPN